MSTVGTVASLLGGGSSGPTSQANEAGGDTYNISPSPLNFGAMMLPMQDNIYNGGLGAQVPTVYSVAPTPAKAPGAALSFPGGSVSSTAVLAGGAVILAGLFLLSRKRGRR